jgi:hypothetical protein
MAEEYDIKTIAGVITSLRQNAEKLKEIAADNPAVQKNTDRILANIRMLEININDVVEMAG